MRNTPNYARVTPVWFILRNEPAGPCLLPGDRVIVTLEAHRYQPDK